jgi:sugar lactone lactonase YvrE
MEMIGAIRHRFLSQGCLGWGEDRVAYFTRIARAWFCFVLALASLPVAASNPPEVDRALAWLAQQPQANGTLAGEAASIATPLQARAETLVTLKQLGTAPTALGDIVAQEPSTATEYAARQVIALAPLGRDVSVAMAAVLAAQNTDGGFGGAPGYSSDALDSAYALLALKAGASANSNAISKALGYLQGTQGTDGSFGINDQPSVFVTAHALQALNAFAQTFALTANIQSAKTYLTGAQTNGAYTTVLDNATAALGLSGATLDTSVFSGAQASLKSTQAADGSWADDPYLTALAIRALVATASAPPPATTGQVSGNVVDQATGTPLAGVQVQLTGAGTASTSTDSSGAFTLTGMAPGSYTVQVSLAGYTPVTLNNVAVTAGVVSSLGTIRLAIATTTASLQGTVRDGTTGQPIAGATIAISGGPTTTTDATGAYQLSGIIPGAVTISLSATGYQTVTLSATLSAGVIVAFSPSLYAPGQGPTDAALKGKIVDRATGQPIANAAVAVGSQSAATSATGDFSITPVPVGSASINVSAAGYVSVTYTATLSAGVNDVGTLMLDKQAASVTISGHVSDSTAGTAIGGATLQVVGTTLTATTDATGRYSIAGVTTTQFTLSVAAAGYQSKQAAVTLPTLVDSTVDVTLDRVPVSGINIVGIAQDATSYDPYTKFDLDVSVQNTGAAAANLVLTATVNDALGNPVIHTFPQAATIPGATTTTVELEPHLANQPAGTYGILVQAFAGDGTLVAEGTSSFGINAVQRISGGITLDPPITQSGTGQPVHITANLANLGNLPVPAGPVSLSVTLVNPDANGVPTAHITAGAPAASGTPLNGPVGAGMDAQGNYYAVNRNDRRVFKVTPDGQMTVVTTLPATLSAPSDSIGPVDAVADSAGNVYVLNAFTEIIKVAPDGTFTRILTNLPSQNSFTRDAAGNFYVVYSNNGLKVARIDPSGAQTIWEAQGFSSPQGIVHAADGNLYIDDRTRAAIFKVTPQGAVSLFAQLSTSTTLSGMTQDGAGNFYVSNPNQNNVLKVTPQGAVSPYATGFNGPSDLQFDTQGNLFVINQFDSTIMRVPAGGGAAQLFARSLVSAPQGMAYDNAGNLFIAGNSGQLVRLDPSNNLSVVSTAISSPKGLAINAAGDVFVASIGNGTITRTSGTTTTTFAAGLSSPYGVAFDTAGTLYAAESAGGANRIDAFDASGVKTVAAQSMVTSPQDVYVAANGDRYVLNQDSITTTPAAGGAVRVVAQNGFSGLAFAPAADGGFYVQENSTIKRVSPAGVVTAVTTATTLPSLSTGITADASGNLLVGDLFNKKILRIDSAGNVTTVATVPENPTTIIDDQAGGVYTNGNSGDLFHITAAGVVTQLNNTGANVGSVSRISLDPVGNKIYLLNSTNVRAFDVATRSVTTVGTISSMNAFRFTGSGFLLTNVSTRELVSMTLQGQATTILAGFQGPTALTSDGTQLYFFDALGRVLAFTPGGYPRILAGPGGIRHLAWHAGTLYATQGSGVVSFTPGVDTAFGGYLNQTTSLQGLAFRADGAMTLGLDGESRVLTYDASKQIVASYAGIASPAGIAVDGSGNVFVGSTSNQQVVRIAPDGKQSTVFASGIGIAGLTFDAGGVLYAASASPTRVVRFDGTGAQTVVASTSLSGTPRSLAVSSDGIFMVDQFFEAVRKAVGTDLPIFALGISSPGQAIPDPAGNGVLVASVGNGAVVRVANGVLTPVVSNLPNATGLGYASNGNLLVAASTGVVWAVDGSANSTQLTNLASLFNSGLQMGFITIDPSGLIYALDSVSNVPRIERLTYIPATPPPAPGAVVFTGSATFGGLGIDSLPVPVDFGSWVPPYGGDFQLTVTTGSTTGQATNVLHVGPNANGQIVPAQLSVPPGNSPLALTVQVNGADFTTLAKVDPANVTASAVTPITPAAMGPDGSGNLLFTSSGDTRLRRMTPAGVTTTLFTLPVGTVGMRGLVPVDDAGNAYISGGGANFDIWRVAPDGTGTKFASVTESVVSLTRTSNNVLYALGTAHIFRIATDGTVTTLSVPPFSNAYSLTIDGHDNLYGQFFNTIDMFGADGSVTNVVRPDANGEPSFEHEGVNVSGDCADNVFLTPFVWDAVGQRGGVEEHVLVEYVGKTGKAAQILDGLTLNPQLGDLDFIAYDRFSESLLMWTDVDGRIHHIPVTCGAISTDLHLVFPAGQAAGSFDVTPKQAIQNADGSTEYVWSFKDVTHLGNSLHLTTTLPNVKLGDVVPVASSAFLVFQNTFVAGSVTVPLTVPTVGVDGMVDIGVATDQPQYDANTDVVSTVTLTNRDSSAKTGTLTVQVTDPQGAVLAIASQGSVSIPANSSITVNPPFNTGTILTGSYVMKATLADPNTGATIATGSAGFDIVAGGAVVISSITTDKQVYGAVDTATINSRVRNVSDNAIASNLTTFVTVKDPSGATLLSGSGAVPVLVPQALKDSPFTLKLSAAAAGTYTVTETLVDSTQATVETRTTEFAVLSTADTGSGVRGAVTTSKLANTGDPVTITATVANQGNAALANLPVTIKVVNPSSGQLVQQWAATANVPQGGSTQLPQIWDTTGTAAGSYIAAASVTFGGREIVLGQDTVTIGAIQAFAFAPRSDVPVNALVESDPVTVAGLVAPAPISVAVGEYRIGNSGWTGAPGFVNPGDVVTVRVTSSSAFGATTTAVLTIAGFSAPFAVTTVNPDITPDPFSFAPVTNAPLATLETSNTVTITGIDIPVPIAIAGGEYSVNGGAWTSAAGTVNSGDTVAVRVISAATLGATSTATLTVSNVSAPFNVTTTAQAVTPNPFTFMPQDNVPVSTVRVSNTVTITGINTSVSISVTGGEYSINGGPFTSAAGTIANGNSVTVRHTSSASFSTTVTTQLNISGVIGVFASTTEGEDSTPDAITFTPQTSVPLTTQLVSNSATITGINTTVAISVAGGDYSVNGGAYTSAAGTVKNGDAVTVRQTSASTFATTTTATLTVGTVSAPFAVTTKASADVKTTPVFAGDERLLVLVSCKGDSDEDDDPSCVAQRVPFLDGYLTNLGIIHRIVTTTLDFKSEMRSGRYDAYWISGGAEKLMDDLAEEVREAAFRGETLIMDGVHDQRNGDLDEVVGIDYRGKPSALNTVTLTGSMLPAGSFTVSGSKPIRVRLTTGVRQGVFNTGDPAIATNTYGYGNGLLFAFDLTGTLVAQPSSTLLQSTLDGALAFVTPAVPTTVSGGAYIPLSVTLENNEAVAVNVDVTATLPAGFALAAGAPPAIVSGSTVTWHVALPANGKQDLEFAVRAPTASGSYSIALALNQIYGSTSVPDGTATIPVVVSGLDAGLPALIAQLQALSLSSGGDRSARDGTVANLQAASAAISTASWDNAVDALVNAVAKLDSINAVDTRPYQAAIDNVMKEVEERWWAALPACPATAPCRTP